MTSPSGFRRIGERVVHEWGIWTLVAADFQGPDGEEFDRHFVRSPGAVAVVPLLFGAVGRASVLLVDQYRAAFDTTMLELPAGMRDVDGEAPEETARRELAEEIGYTAGRLEFLTEYLPSPSLTDATLRLYVASDLERAARQPHGPEEMHMRVVHLPLSEAVRRVRAGDIGNAAAVIGLLLVADRLGVR
jgi:ADP-ribose pyrophosphatase